jgi:hypothetical protein
MGVRTICPDGYPVNVCRCPKRHDPVATVSCPPGHLHRYRYEHADTPAAAHDEEKQPAMNDAPDDVHDAPGKTYVADTRRLTRAVRIVERDPTQDAASPVITFSSPHEPGELGGVFRVDLDEDSYRDMGCPNVLTVEVVPGDQLNGL